MDEQTLRSKAMARSVAATLAGAQAKQQRQPSSDLQQQQQQQHHTNSSNRQQYHDNNNNGNGNGNNNNNKVRLLITPAAQTTDGPAYGSSRMDRSATIITTTTTATLTTIDSPQQQYQQHHNQQQQQLRSQTLQNSNSNNNNRQKNYHHYDYYTDSDITSSLTTTTPANNNSYGSNNNYDQNILLFATEHTRPNGNQQQYPAPNRADKLREQQQQQQQRLHLAYGQLEPQQQGRMASSASFNQQPLSSHGSQLYGSSCMQTGKFINYYPSWRQTQSPTTNHQNYSFHVPLQYGRRQQPPSRPQSRYGFVTPGGESRAKLSSRSSFKSRTLGHIPQSVRDDPQQQQRQQTPPSSVSIRLRGNKQEPEEEQAEINYYDQPTLTTRQFMLSEGDLLKVRQVVLEDGPENPFKPGTELSWEAEMMVRLMKRGYPIQELPALVESAKQVAAGGNGQPLRAGEAGSRASLLDRAPKRRQSSHDLSGEMKQVWASSLSRARSMPRFYTTTTNTTTSDGENKQDADSIDLLITSIENEMMVGDEPTDDVTEVNNNNKALNGITQKTKTTRQGRALPSSGPNTRASMEESSASALNQQLAAPSPKQRQRKKSNERQRNTSEQQVVAADRRGKTSASKSVAAVAVKPKQGKYNQQQKVRGKKNSSGKADLSATNNNSNQIKKHKGCCTIQ